jgi:predicted GIY-YIG superfamily endonuclease
MSILHIYRQIKKYKFDKVIAISTDCIIIDSKEVYDIPYKTKENSDKLGMLTRESKINVPTIKYRPFTTNKIFEFDNERKIFNIDSIEAQDEIIIRIALGESFACNRPGGFGKSFFTKRVIAHMRSIGKKIAICGATANAAYGLDKEARTLHSFMGITFGDNENSNAKDDWTDYWDLVIIDEFFFLNNSIYMKVLQKKLRYNTPLLILGCTRQLCCSVMIKDNGALFKSLVNNNYLYMLENRRCKCPLLLKLTQQYLDYIDRKIIGIDEETEEEIIAPYPSLSHLGKQHHPLALCVSNNTAELLNDYWCSKFEVLPVAFECLSFKLFVGLPLIATKNTDKYINSQHFNVGKIEDKKITLFLSDINSTITNKSIEVSPEEISKDFVRGYAMTCHKSQSKTITVPYSIYDIELSKALGRKEENSSWRNYGYVAVSRGEYLNQINICELRDIISVSHKVYAYIYRATHKISKHFYIGSTFDLNRRKEEHKESKFIIENGGYDMFTWDVLDAIKKNIKKRELFKIENEAIDLYKPYYNRIYPSGNPNTN